MKEKRVGWHMYYATPMEGTEYRSLHTPLQIIYSDTKQNQLFSFIQFLSIIPVLVILYNSIINHIWLLLHGVYA